MKRKVFLVAVISLVAACGGSTGPGNGNAATGDFDVTIGSGTLLSANTEPTLTNGMAYRVSITRADQKAGVKEFTP